MSQDICPYPYQGVPKIEAEVTREVANFGRRLGTISEAVLEIAKKAARSIQGVGDSAAIPHDPKAGQSALAKLQAIVEAIDGIKARRREAMARDAERALARLRKVSPSKAATIAAQFRARWRRPEFRGVMVVWAV